MFDRKSTGSSYTQKLQEDSKLYHSKSFPMPYIQKPSFKKEWAALTFIKPKINGSVRFISDFRKLKKRIKRKPLPMVLSILWQNSSRQGLKT